LYRVFAKEGESVAAAIWTARLVHATRMLGTTACADLLISQIAFRSGFADHSTFDRMFKRLHGMTPGEMRHAKRLSGFESAYL
jgi:transcriptional regulator GlxA family with amidase domain